MRDVFLCGPMRGSSVGDYPIKVGTFPNVFASRSKVKKNNETLIIKKDKKREKYPSDKTYRSELWSIKMMNQTNIKLQIPFHSAYKENYCS